MSGDTGGGRVEFVRIAERLEVAAEVKSVAVGCHLCSTVKQGVNADRALYELAFHYDRRHRGWTNDEA